uniref:Uncharacterized protein n=1 Tax=Fagus sylvatica TaxID=28930 RepID=A0A2N9H3H5_FAGSY
MVFGLEVVGLDLRCVNGGEPLQSRLRTLLSQPRHHGDDAVQVIELLRESEVEKVGLIGGDQVQHSSDFKISVLSLEISESVSDLGVWPVVLSEVEKRLEKSSEREKTGRSDKISGPSNGNNLGLT